MVGDPLDPVPARDAPGGDQLDQRAAEREAHDRPRREAVSLLDFLDVAGIPSCRIRVV
jgi:hypothetical protein